MLTTKVQIITKVLNSHNANQFLRHISCSYEYTFREDSVFDKIINTNSDIIDADTGNYIGKAYFVLTPDAEKSLLNYLRQHRTMAEAANVW